MKAQSDMPLLPEKTLVEYCDEWLSQYQSSYDVMNRICSSAKGNRYSFSTVTQVKLCQDEEGEYYHISLNMLNGAKEVFLEGPSLDISSNCTEEVAYLLANMVNIHRDKQKVLEMESPFTGKIVTEKPRVMPSYRPASMVLDFSDCLSNPKVVSAVTDQINYGYLDQFDQMMLLVNRFEAEDAGHIVDNRFMNSLSKSTEQSSNILSYGNVKKR